MTGLTILGRVAMARVNRELAGAGRKARGFSIVDLIGRWISIRGQNLAWAVVCPETFANSILT
jgi:hypothetical protein